MDKTKEDRNTINLCIGSTEQAPQIASAISKRLEAGVMVSTYKTIHTEDLSQYSSLWFLYSPKMHKWLYSNLPRFRSLNIPFYILSEPSQVEVCKLQLPVTEDQLFEYTVPGKINKPKAPNKKANLLLLTPTPNEHIALINNNYIKHRLSIVTSFQEMNNYLAEQFVSVIIVNRVINDHSSIAEMNDIEAKLQSYIKLHPATEIITITGPDTQLNKYAPLEAKHIDIPASCKPEESNELISHIVKSKERELELLSVVQTLRAENSNITLHAARHLQSQQNNNLRLLTSSLLHRILNATNLGISACRMQQRIIEKEDYKKLTPHISAAMNSLVSITNTCKDLRLYAYETKDISTTKVNLQKVIMHAIFHVQQIHNIKDIKAFIPSDIYLDLDEYNFSRAIANIICNGIEATQSKTKAIIIRANQAESGSVEINIEDKGKGMNAEQIRNAMKPFNTQKPGHGGLGLPIAELIINLHSGKIIILSSSEKGTVIQVKL